MKKKKYRMINIKVEEEFATLLDKAIQKANKHRLRAIKNARGHALIYLSSARPFTKTGIIKAALLEFVRKWGD